MSNPTTDKSEEMPTLANGVRPSLIHPSVTGDSAAAAVDVDQPPDVSCTDTPFTDGVCRLRLAALNQADQTTYSQMDNQFLLLLITTEGNKRVCPSCHPVNSVDAVRITG